MAKLPVPSEVGRLAFRVEGTMWNAYWAMPGTMKGALWLGSIALAGIDKNPTRKQAFVDLMQNMVTEILEEVTGQKVERYETRTAPASEQTKE